MNYFDSKQAAGRYAAGRPDFHANTMARVAGFLKIDEKLDKALDIACGIGLSTKALLKIANKVYGTDLSAAMLSYAGDKHVINYQVSPAEKQPFEDEQFDLITVSSGVHWFNIDEFLAEAKRILKLRSWLVLYENYFAAEMKDANGFKKWVNEVYLKWFPSPPRNKTYDWSVENIKLKGFSIHLAEDFTNTVSFNRQQLINYLTTQSNIIAAVESQACSYSDAEEWLANELSLYFTDEQTVRQVYFGNRIKYLQKTAY